MASLKDRLERVSRGESRRSFDLFAREAPALSELLIEEVIPDPDQPRKDMGDLEGLKASIAEYGIMQPLIVSPDPQSADRYRLVAGERRYTAAKELGLETVPAIVRSVEEHQRLELQLIENLHRKDLNPLEEAVGYQRLIDDFGLTQEEIARRVGKSKAAINQTLRILSLPEEMRSEAQTSEHLTKSVLLEIAKQDTPEERQSLWEQAKRGELTVKKARAQKARPQPDVSRGEVPRSMTFRYPIHTDEAVVTVTFPDRASADLEEIIAALEQALEGEKARRPV